MAGGWVEGTHRILALMSLKCRPGLAAASADVAAAILGSR